MIRRNRSKTDLESIKRFRKFRDAMKQLQEEPSEFQHRTQAKATKYHVVNRLHDTQRHQG